jgi:hypothetical protein
VPLLSKVDEKDEEKNEEKEAKPLFNLMGMGRRQT